MKHRWINLLLLLAFLICYLEWGGDNSGFIFQLEYDVFNKLNEGVDSVMHPLIVIPLFGQLALLYNLFQKKPNRNLALIGILMLSMLVLLLLFVGILSLNPKMIISTLPFISFSSYYFFSKSMKMKPETD